MNADSKDKVKGVPVTIVILFWLSRLGIPAVWSWGDAFYILLSLIGALLMVSAMMQLHQVMDAYSVLEDVHQEALAKDPELLTEGLRVIGPIAGVCQRLCPATAK